MLYLVLAPISDDFPNFQQRKLHYQNHLSNSTNVIEQATKNNSIEIMRVNTVQNHCQKEVEERPVVLKMQPVLFEQVARDNYQPSLGLEYYDERTVKNELDDHLEKQAIPETHYLLGKVPTVNHPERHRFNMGSDDNTLK